MDLQMTREDYEKVMLEAQQRLPMWVVYRPVTREYPGSWIARMFLSLPKDSPTIFVLVRPTLDTLRAALPRGLVCLNRDPNDVPEIEEVWF